MDMKQNLKKSEPGAMRWRQFYNKLEEEGFDNGEYHGCVLAKLSSFFNINLKCSSVTYGCDLDEAGEFLSLPRETIQYWSSSAYTKDKILKEIKNFIEELENGTNREEYALKKLMNWI